MWSEFYLAAAVLCFVLFAPGFLALRSLGMARTPSACCAPIVSIALVSVLGQLYYFAGVTSSPALLLAPLIAILAIGTLVLRKRFGSDVVPARVPAWVPLVFLAIGVALSHNLFVSRLDDAAQLFQAYDLTHHLNAIRAMVDSGKFTSLGVSPYLTAPDAAIAPVDYSSFYPSAWHVTCAIVVQMTGVSVPVVINASMFVFVGVVFPLAMSAFLASVFPGERHLVLFGAVATVSFVAFPWLLLAFGPVFPNIAGFACMPAAMTFFVEMIAPSVERSGRVRLAALLALTVVGMALLHPNTVFTCVVILAPYAVTRIWHARVLSSQAPPRRLAACVAFVVFCLAVWLLCYKLPLFRDIVTHQWNSFARPWQEVVNILTQTYSMGFFSEVAAQLLLGALVVIGAIRSLYLPGRRWLCVSYALTCLICFMGATRNDGLQHLFAGFWYTDPMRLGAMASIAAMPLAAMGLEWAYLAVVGVLGRYNERRGRKTHTPLAAIVVSCGFMLVNFMPEFNLPGLHYQYTAEDLSFNREVRDSRDWAKSVHTTFGDYRDIIVDVYTYGTPLDSGEEIFLDGVREIVGDDLVLNDPMDGSFLAYGYNDVRVYNRNFTGFGGSRETDESAVIRTRLYDIASDEEVLEAVRSTGARYVMVMRQDDSEYSLINQRGDFKPELFSGISSIGADTPGFTRVYRYGTMELYEIDAMS